jgi:type II secretory pathway pseudopilin PulG
MRFLQRHAARLSGDDGYTLTEVLVALVMLSLSITAIVAAIGSSIFTSRVHRALVTGDAAARAYSAQIAQDLYVPCATTYPAMTNPPGGMTVTITSITYWNGSASGSNFVSGCGTDNGAQQIVITATPANGAGKQLLSMVKRAP